MRTSTTFCMVALGVLLAACSGDSTSAMPASMTVAEALGGGSDAGFARALAPPQLHFPRDHGAHPDFRSEWWYVTGNVATAAGRRFGVQLVFFRQALAALGAVAPRTASLAAREVVLAHAAVTDVDGHRFYAEQQMVRAAGGVAGVRGGTGPADPFAVACGDWSAKAVASGDGFLPLQLQATGIDFAFELMVSPGKPLVLQGDGGLSQKSDEPGNASIYYSLTRSPIAGRIVAGHETHEVRGEAWLDREWSTSALGPEQVGWDWFSLQLDDGTEVMWYQLRRRDGALDRWSRGCFVARDGTSTRLAPDAVEALPEGTWTATDGGASYPARWRLRGRGASPFELEVTPLLPDQELRVLVRYWEGAVAVRGTRDGKPVTGCGYLEMTGYSRRP